VQERVPRVGYRTEDPSCHGRCAYGYGLQDATKSLSLASTFIQVYMPLERLKGMTPACQAKDISMAQCIYLLFPFILLLCSISVVFLVSKFGIGQIEESN
jgi:hypothetical protein